MGKERLPANISAYKRSHRHNNFYKTTPEKVHRITIILETKNHVGLLGDVCGVLTEEEINILRINAVTEHKPGRAEIKIMVEVKDFDQYERAVHALRKLSGIVNVKHVANGRRRKRQPIIGPN